jgi:hypothetical protein
MLSYLRDQALVKDESYQIMQLYQNYPELSEDQIKEVLTLAWNFLDILKTGDSLTIGQTTKKNLFLFKKGFA